MAYKITDSYPFIEGVDVLKESNTSPSPYSLYKETDTYPILSQSDSTLDAVTYPTPIISLISNSENKYPHFMYVDILPSSLVEPYPLAMWASVGDYPILWDKEPLDMGAMLDCSSLNTVKFNTSKQQITFGEYSAKNTALTEVELNSGCTIYDTTFPEGCNVILRDS